MDVKEAVKLAKAYILDLFGDEQLSDVGLEEVSIDEQTRIWKITVGFARPWDKVRTGSATALGASPRRSYKVVRIDDATQQAISVMNRDSVT